MQISNLPETISQPTKIEPDTVDRTLSRRDVSRESPRKHAVCGSSPIAVKEVVGFDPQETGVRE